MTCKHLTQRDKYKLILNNTKNNNNLFENAKRQQRIRNRTQWLKKKYGRSWWDEDWLVTGDKHMLTYANWNQFWLVCWLLNKLTIWNWRFKLMNKFQNNKFRQFAALKFNSWLPYDSKLRELKCRLIILGVEHQVTVFVRELPSDIPRFASMLTAATNFDGEVTTRVVTLHQPVITSCESSDVILKLNCNLL